MQRGGRCWHRSPSLQEASRPGLSIAQTGCGPLTSFFSRPGSRPQNHRWRADVNAPAATDGAGGVGSAIAASLAAAGVTRMGLVDVMGGAPGCGVCVLAVTTVADAAAPAQVTLSRHGGQRDGTSAAAPMLAV
jgi:hypothetical protein